MCGVRVVLLSLLAVLVVLAGLPPVTRSATPDPENLLGLAPILEVKLKEWLVAWRTVQPGFKIEQFTVGHTRSSLLKGPGEAVDLKIIDNDPLRAFYALSPDGRWIVDPYGGVGLYKVSKDDFRLNAGPDTTVLLIDRKTSRLREILSCGTTCGFHEAAWISNDIFFMAGWIRLEQAKQGCAENSTIGPTLNSFNLPRSSSIWYRDIGPDSCNGIGPEYMVEKIRKKIPNLKY